VTIRRGEDRPALRASTRTRGTPTRDLGETRKAAAALAYRTSAEIEHAVPELRRRASEIMSRKLERDVPLADAVRAGIQHPAANETERAGLMPGSSSPSVLGGTVRFTRRDS